MLCQRSTSCDGLLLYTGGCTQPAQPSQGWSAGRITEAIDNLAWLKFILLSVSKETNNKSQHIIARYI